MKRTYETEFPDFGPMDVVAPEGFVDGSWHNDVMPCFERELSDKAVLRIWVNYADRSKREEGENAPRFAVVLYDEGSITRQTLVESNNWDEIVDTARAAALK